MPFLSLIQVRDYPSDQIYIVGDGKLDLVRSDVMVDELKPTSLFGVSVIF